MDTANSAEDAVKDVMSAETKDEQTPAKKPEETIEQTVDAAENGGTATSSSEVEQEEVQIDKNAASEPEQKTEKSSKADTADSTAEEEEGAMDESDEKFEDAIDSEDKLEAEQIIKTNEQVANNETPSKLTSEPSTTTFESSSSENIMILQVAESYEIEDSPEKSPVKMVANPAALARPGPSSVKRLPLKSPEIVTVDLDDDDDDDDDDAGVPAAKIAAVRRAAYAADNDEEYGEEEEDDYYDDPDSDDDDVGQVLQDGYDDMNANVSSDEEDEDGFSEDESYARQSLVVDGASGSGKRKRSDYSEEDEESYGYDEDEPEEDADDDDEEMAEVIGKGEKLGGKRPPKAPVSMGQISVEDESDEDVALLVKKKFRKVKYKTYRQKLMAKIRRRTYKLLNKRSMHVMEEGSDALVCSDAAKIVSLKSAVSSVGVKTVAEEATAIKDPKPKEDQTATPGALVRKDSEEAVVASGDAVKDLSEHKKDDENKENMTVKDNAKEVPRRVEVDEKVKARDDQQKDQEQEDCLTEDVMDSIDNIIADAKKQNGSKSDFNEELTFQMDVDGSDKDDEDNYEPDEDDDVDEEEEEEEGAVDLSSSYDANKSDRQTDDSDAVETIDSSPEKDLSVVGKPTRKPGPLQLDRRSFDSRKSSADNQIVVKKEIEDDSDENPETIKESTTVSANKSSPSRAEKQSEKPRETEAVSRKRRRSVDPDDQEDGEEPLVPSKKLKRELETNYPTHDRLLKEYIETTSNHSVDDIQKHTDALMVEIQTLNEMIRAKEIEWNNMIHLKKVKEEILLRLTRKKHVMDVMQTKLGEVSEYSHFDSSNLTNVRSASVGPRPPTPPPEVDIRPASVTPLHSSTLNNSRNANASVNSISASRQIPGSKDNSLFAQFNHSNSSVTMVPLSTSSSLITSTNTILQSRANMKSAEVAKEKSNVAQIQRQILPKPVLSNHQQILNNLAMSAGLTAACATSSGTTSISSASTTATVASAANLIAGLSNNILAGLSAQTAALLNGHHHPSASNHLSQSNQLQVGRQGVIKDVKSIIADYRQKHPEQVPRRGRRLKNIPGSSYDGITITNKSGSSRMPELGFLLGEQQQQQSQQNSVASNLSKNSYPEVTLHPVMNSSSASGSNADVNHSAGNNSGGGAANQSQNNSSNTNSTNSLLHGILTKSSSRPNATGFTSFSPTLARLLTAPERMNSQAATVTSGALANLQANTGLNLSKPNSEITITPVVASNLQQSLLAHQQQLQEQQKQLQRLREQHFMSMDDEADDSVDRLVIDEGDDHHHHSTANNSRSDGHRESGVVIAARGGNGPEFHENDVPECQGCKKREAQFVCAGCGNQWYCSRECQVNAWDDHSEVCTG
ncbi:uncharacterized protein LOC134226655 isoform X2 [Armigeres subalbatus]|uniref:uncharacterized protein LOC134226655 isoform X2 n=1 Tax=Armigeres subalbatus TaxID=124917 RepID=UPI002ED4F52D